MDEDEGGEVAKMLLGTFGHLSAAMDEALNPRYEYARVPWAGVNPLARGGWELALMTPHYIPGEAERLYIMFRKLGVADQAAEMLKVERDG